MTYEIDRGEATALPVRSVHIIDDLIDERATNLRKVPLLWETLRFAFDPPLRYRTAVEWSNRLACLPGETVLDILDQYLDLDVSVTGLENVPQNGRVMILSNHPTGMVDGLAIYRALRGKRPDICFFANRDALRLVPDLADRVIPVEWMVEKRSAENMRQTVRATRRAIDAERAIIMFPAGGIARATWRGLRDLDWIPSSVKLITRFGVPAIPLHIRAHNSWLYYLFSLLHPELRDLTRFNEILHKQGKPFELIFGPAIPKTSFEGPPATVISQIQRYVGQDLPGPGQRASCPLAWGN